MDHDLKLDAIGLLCPLPVLKARKRLMGMRAKQVLCMVCDDPASQIDVAHFCNQNGHELISTKQNGTVFEFRIRKKPNP